QECGEQGRIEPGQRWFNTSPEVVNYLAWFCPGERGALDHRLELFGRSARDYAELRKSLTTAPLLPRPRAPAAGAEPEKPPEWRRILGEWRGPLPFFPPFHHPRAPPAPPPPSPPPPPRGPPPPPPPPPGPPPPP